MPVSMLSMYYVVVILAYFQFKYRCITLGSTILQGKVNPTQCEALTMVCAQVYESCFFTHDMYNLTSLLYCKEK
jgi:hypothetical protein